MFEQKDFMPNDFSKGWDGKFRRQPADIGVYVYLSEVLLSDGQIIILEGEVSLVR